MILMSKDKSICMKPGCMNYKAPLTYLTDHVHILENVCWRCVDNKGQIVTMTMESSVKVTHT